MSDDNSMFRDLDYIDAVDRERSHVSGRAYRKISEIVQDAIDQTRVVAGAGSAASTKTIARLLVENLDASELEGVVMDWLEGRGAPELL